MNLFVIANCVIGSGSYFVVRQLCPTHSLQATCSPAQLAMWPPLDLHDHDCGSALGVWDMYDSLNDPFREVQ